VETLEDYLKRLASKDPVPGGGSAAALVASIGAALVAMVGRIMAAPVAELVSRAERLHLELNEARCRDEAAYAAVVAAQALPKRDDTERAARRNAIQAALHEAAREPLHAARLALEVLKLTRELVDAETRALASDVGCAAEFAYAAITACAYNVRINHRYMRATDIIAAQSAELAGYEAEALVILQRVRSAVASALERP
jgi:formiminotetrahydrofolate cyclodeaminase